MFDIKYGLMNGMVACRNENDFSNIEIGGTVSAEGPLSVSFNGGKETVCGQADGKNFSGRITTIPVGGPYRVELRAGNEKTVVENVYVGDLWVLAGQSNMQGCGRLDGAEKNDNPMVRAFFMDEHWDIARDPIHNIRTAKAAIHWTLQGITNHEELSPEDPLNKGTGPGVSAIAALHRITGVPQGVLACAHGGTVISQWDPELKNKGNDSLYGAMMNRVRKNGGSVSGVFWYQGESDADDQWAPVYEQKMDRFLTALRADLKDPELPFILVQLARVTSANTKCWNEIRRIQLEFAYRHSRVMTVPSVDLELDDSIHLFSSAYHILGERLAHAVCAMRQKEGFLPPIEPESAVLLPNQNDIVVRLEITFRNVTGKLLAPGRPSGFSLNGKDTIIRTELSGKKVVLIIPAGTDVREVSYGYGTNPYCNIADESGRSLPCFTMPVAEKYPKTGYIRKIWVTDPVLMDDNVRKLEYSMIPADAGSLDNSSGCWSLCRDRINTPHKPGFRFFRALYDCPAEQDLRILVGYDGPSKVFCDKVCVHENPEGTNPIIPDQYSIPVHWTQGIHEIIVAEVLRNGNTYGITLQLEAAQEKPSVALPAECSGKYAF